MNQQQREAALRLAGYLDDWAYRLSTRTAAEAAALLRSLAEEKQGEPVAWLYDIQLAGKGQRHTYASISDSERRFEDITDADWAARVMAPLYTHPPAKQEPLTEEEIAIALTPVVPGLLKEQARTIESACAKKWGVKL